MNMRRTMTAGFIALLLAGCGVSGNFRHDPGYAAFGRPGPLVGQRELGLSLGPLPLALARFVMADDEEIGAILQELRAVRVYVYDVTRDSESVARHLREVQADLIADGWLPLVTVKDGTEQVAVLLRAGEEGRNRGLAVIVHDSTETVLVNLIGNVRLDLVGSYLAELDVATPPIELDPATLRAARGE
jgi:hypothetical protein